MNHYKMGVCDWCPKSNKWQGTCIVQADGTLACPKCNYDLVLRAKVDSEANEPETINPNSVLTTGKDILSAIETGADVFNAPTIEFEKIRTAIFEDEKIENKNLTYTKYVKEQFSQLKGVIYNKQIEIRKLSGEIKELNQQQVEIQSYLNRLANQLTKEEQEQLQLKDVTYAPTKVKQFVPRPPKVKKVKVAEAEAVIEAQRASKEIGTNIEVQTILALCIARNFSAVEAADFLISRKKLKEQKTEHERIDAEEKKEESNG